MFESALQNAVDGVWNNTLGRLAWLVPDWLAWLLSYPLDVWVIWGIALALGYVLGKLGLGPTLAIGGLFTGAWFLGRKSKPSSDEIAPHAPPIPRPDPRDLEHQAGRKTFLERLFKRGG